MARFTVAKLDALPSPGVFAGRIIVAREKTAESGNPTLRLRARFHDGSELPFVITLAASEKAAKLVGYFARSCDIVLPPAGAEAELRAADVENRLFFAEVALDENGEPRIVKFLSKQEACVRNPEIGKLSFHPQEPLRLQPVDNPKEAL